MMGIYSSQLNQNCLPNAKKLYFSLSLLHLLVSTAAFIVCEAKSIDEFANAFYLFSSGLSTLVFYSVPVCKAPQIFTLVEHFEEFIEKRKKNIRLSTSSKRINEFENIFRRGTKGFIR